MAIQDPGLLVLGDSRWVKDSKAFLPGPLVLARLFLRFSDLFVAMLPAATWAAGLVPATFPKRIIGDCQHLDRDGVFLAQGGSIGRDGRGKWATSTQRLQGRV